MVAQVKNCKDRDWRSNVRFCADAMGRAAKVRHLWRSAAADGAPHVATF
jgi:hypothetical protein